MQNRGRPPRKGNSSHRYETPTRATLGSGQRRLGFEHLESRWLLDAGPLYISEFMANNNTTYENNYGKYTDWLELYNPTTSAIALGSASSSYYLTNDASNLTMWSFPNGVSVAAGGYLVISCSGGTPLSGAYTNTSAVGPWPANTTQFYTNFKLPSDGGYVALVQPDGQTIASQYDYPSQLADVSYGTLITTSSTSLVSPGAAARYLVPSSTVTGWTGVTYNDTAWSSGTTGMGFGPTYTAPTTLPGAGYYAPYGPNGTWNYYIPVTTATTWEAAQTYAASQSFKGQTGHLVTVRSAAEGGFLWSLIGGTNYWIGLTNSTTFGGFDYGSEKNNSTPAAGSAPTAATLGVTGITYSGTTATVTTAIAHGLSTNQQVYISGATPAVYNGSYTVTVTGTNTFTYTLGSTPASNASGAITALVPQKGYGFVWSNGEAFTYQAWSSNQPGDTSSNAAPANYVYATSAAGAWDDRSDTNTTARYVVEFNLGLTAAPDGGNFSVVEAHGSAALSSISDGINLINAGTGTVTKYTAGVVGYYDPQAVVAGHFASFPFGGDTTATDVNFAVRVRGTIVIPTTGTYTFLVNSDDGFQLQLGGAAFTGSSTGTTYSGTTMTYSGTRTAPADSLGVTTLAAGTYPLDLYYFQTSTGTPRLELAAASGSYSAYNATAFHLIGDTVNGGLGVVGVNDLVSTNLQSAMQNVNSTALVRIPFSVDNPDQCTLLSLAMEYNDGFVAYLNGVQVAGANAPGSPSWNSAATGPHYSGDATRFESFNLASYQYLLQAGENVLAIQGLNRSSVDNDFLLLPQLQYGFLNLSAVQYFTSPTPGTVNVPGSLGQVDDPNFSVKRGYYTSPFYVTLADDTPGATIRYTLDGRAPTAPGTSEVVSTKSVTSITYSGATATVTCTGHGFSTGQWIRIAGDTTANSYFNGDFVITSLDANTFRYTMRGTPSSGPAGTLTASAISTFTYSGPIYINTTTTLRAQAFLTGYVSSHLDTETYLFMNDVIHTPQIFTDDPTNPFYAANQQYVKNPTYNVNNYPAKWVGIDSSDTASAGGSPTTEGQTQDLYSADYQMDADVVSDPNYASTIVSDMESIPALSLVMNPDDWFGAGAGGTNGIKGIYTNPLQADASGAAVQQWERGTSMEMINSDGSSAFQINAAVQMHGGGSRDPTKTAQHTFTVQFSSLYDGTLNYPLFGPGATSQFGQIVLRGGYNNSITHWDTTQRTHGTYLQDMFSNDELGAMGEVTRHGTFVQLYINGIYWGVYNATEYPDAEFAASYQGGAAADYDMIKVSETGPVTADDGDVKAWNTLFNIAGTGAAAAPSTVAISSITFSGATATVTTSAAHGYTSGWRIQIAGATPTTYNGIFSITVTGSTTFTYTMTSTPTANASGTMTALLISSPTALSTPASLQLIKQYLSVDDFIDYMIVKFYGADQDWDNHNWVALSRSRFNGVATNSFGGFVFINWDGERTLEGVADNRVGTSSLNGGMTSGAEQFGPGFLFNQLKANSEFALLWADHTHKYLINGGPLSISGASVVYSNAAVKIDRAIVGETARWGDWRRDIAYLSPNNGAAYLFTRNGLANPNVSAGDPNYPGNTPATWAAEETRLFTTYFPVRATNVVSQFSAAGVYPNSPKAPEFSGLPDGGYLTGTLSLTNPSGVGTIWYTTDGSDPRVANVTTWIPVTGTPSFASSIVRSGTTATVRVPDHGYAVGQTVQISGANQSGYNGNFVITAVTQDTFTIAVSGTPASPATGTIVVQPYGLSIGPSGTSAIAWWPANGLSVGNRVLMSGAAQSALNGIVTVTAVTANTFTYAFVGAGLVTDTGAAITAQRVDVAISGITYSGTTATVTTTAPHGYSTGNVVRILGASVSTFNGDFVITVLNSTQFRYTMSTTPSGVPSGVMAAVRVTSPTAVAYTGPITLSQAARVRARVLNSTTWSALNDAQFIVNPPAAAGNLAITEINCHPVNPTAAELTVNPGFTTNDFQFIELKNLGSQTISLSGVRLWINYHLAFDFTGSAITTLAPGAFVLVAQNSDAFALRYGSGAAARIAGVFLQNFDHSGDRVALTDRTGKTIEDFTFDTGGDWPGRADGSGSTLEIRDPTGDATDPNNWHSSLDYNGSPARSGAVSIAGVVINEMLSNTQFVAGVGNYGAIELYNSGTTPVDVSGWDITDSLDVPGKFVIPAGTVLAAGQYRVFDDRDFNLAPYSLNSNGVVHETTDVDGTTPLLQLQGDTVNQLAMRRLVLPAGSIQAGQHTILQFDFLSNTQGVVQGIGLDDDDTLGGSSVLYRVFGTGTTGTAVTNANGYYNTLGTWQTYTIDLGVIPTSLNHVLFYLSDTSSGSTYVGADALFRNLRVYPSGAPSSYIDFTHYFALNGAKGGQLWLIKTDATGNPLQFIDNAAYNAAADPVVAGTPQPEAYGRWPNGSGSFYALQTPTLGDANSSPRVGPALPGAGWAIISEVMYDPPDPLGGGDGQQLEYVKIYNPGTTTVTLTSWRLRGAVSYNFATGRTLAAGASLVIVPFDPTVNTDALNRFLARYPAANSSQIVGPYSGALSNGGETLDLLRPGTPLVSDLTYTPRLTEDEVSYGNTVPWPASAHGRGYSLQRVLGTIDWGDAATSWTAGPPTLGLLATPPTGNADSYSNPSGTPLTISAATGVLANDTGSGLSSLLVAAPLYGGLAFSAATGAFTYSPYNSYHGPDSFQYRALDATLESSTVTVVINPPLANGNSYQVTANTAFTAPAASGVLLGDSDPSSYRLRAAMVTPPAHGSLALNGDGSFTYVPTTGYAGTDTFTYVANDGVVDSLPATVNLNVNTLAVLAGDWTDAGLTLRRTVDGLLHVYRTGSNTDAVPAVLFSGLTNVQITGRSSAADALALDFSGGNPLPAGSSTWDGGAGGGNSLVIQDAAANDAWLLSGTQLTVNAATPLSVANNQAISLDLGAGSLDLNGATQTVGSLSLVSGRLLHGTLSNSTVTVQNGTVPANLTGSGSVTKTGAGTSTLSGVNAYSGGTAVQSGVLVIGGAGALPAGQGLTIGASLQESAPVVAVIPVPHASVAAVAVTSAPASTVAAAVHLSEIIGPLPPYLAASRQASAVLPAPSPAVHDAALCQFIGPLPPVRSTASLSHATAADSKRKFAFLP